MTAWVLGMALVLAGCASSTTWVKAGGTKRALARAMTDCKVKVSAIRALSGQGSFMLTQSSDFKECMHGEGWEEAQL